MGLPKWSLLSKLRVAVQKVAFLLKFRVHQWRLASGIAVSPCSSRLGFNERSGLRACTEDGDSGVSGSGCQGSSRHQQGRLVGCPSEEDIDKRAEAFISNFHRQLQMERQVSLELQYLRGHGFDTSITP